MKAFMQIKNISFASISTLKKCRRILCTFEQCPVLSTLVSLMSVNQQGQIDSNMMGGGSHPLLSWVEKKVALHPKSSLDFYCSRKKKKKISSRLII